MNVTGTATLHAPVERVWEALQDPAVLVRTIPGCQRLEATGAAEYRMTVSAGVASIKGSYLATVALTDRHAPSSFVLRAAGQGTPGTVTADVRVTLAGNGSGQTRLDYDADAVVGGMIGGVGQRVLSGVARKTAGEFFAAVDDVLTGRAASAGAGRSAAAAAAPATAGSPAAGAPTDVFGPPTTPGTFADTGQFRRGAAFGAAVALLGALVGGLLARRRT